MGNCLRSLGLQLLVTSWTLCSHQTELQRTLNGLSSRAQEPKGRRRLSVAESMRPRKDWMALLPALTWRISSSVAFGSPSQWQCLHYLQQCCNPSEWLSPPHQWGSGFPGKKKASYLNSYIDPFQTICSAGASLRLLSVPESKPIQINSYARGHSSLVRLGIFIQLVSSEETNRQGNLQAIFFSVLGMSSLIISSSYREVRHSMVFT